MSDEALLPRPESDVYRERYVSAVIATEQNRPGDHAGNFLADAQAMLDSDLLNERDRRFLDYAVRSCIRYRRDDPETPIVWMSGAQWGRFVGAIRRYRESERRRHRELTNIVFRRPATSPTHSTNENPA